MMSESTLLDIEKRFLDQSSCETHCTLFPLSLLTVVSLPPSEKNISETNTYHFILQVRNVVKVKEGNAELNNKNADPRMVIKSITRG